MPYTSDTASLASAYYATMDTMSILLAAVGLLALVWPNGFRAFLRWRYPAVLQWALGPVLMGVGALMCFHLLGPTAFFVQYRRLGFGVGVATGVLGAIFLILPGVRRYVVDFPIGLGNGWLRIVGLGILAMANLFSTVSISFRFVDNGSM